MEYAVLYRNRLEIPDFIISLCLKSIVIESQQDFEDFKEGFWSSEYSEEWAWYNGLGRGTRGKLRRLLDHEIPEGLQYADRVANPTDWQIAGEFIQCLVEVIREKELVGSEPCWREGELYFTKEVFLA